MDAAEVKRRYEAALAEAAAGRPAPALAGLETILAARPDLPEVQFKAGQVNLAIWRPARAATHFATAARLRPAEPAIWAAWAEAVALAADRAGERDFLAALRKAPLDPSRRIALQDRFGPRPHLPPAPPALRPLLKRMADLTAAGRAAEAETLAQSEIARAPGLAVLFNLLAGAQLRQTKTEAALGSLRRAVKIDPLFAEAWLNLGQLAADMGRADEAAPAFRAAVVAAPNHVPALVSLAGALARAGHLAPALPLAQKAADAAPRDLKAHLMLARVLGRGGDHQAAEAAYARAVALAPDLPDPHAERAQKLADLGRDAEAMAEYDRALALAPDHAMAIGGKAALLQTLGRFDEAEACFRRAFAVDSRNGSNYRMFVASHKVTPDDPVLAQMQALYADPSLPDAARMDLGFALAKAMEDIRAHDRVFTYLRPANALMRKAHPYDIAAREAEVEAVIAAFRGADFGPLAGATDYAPIFVTGMPRSGTTLIEQIISSHSTMTGAGEAAVAVRKALALVERPDGSYRPYAEVPAAEVVAMGRAYEAEMRARFPQAVQVTDKSIQTYMYLGAIRQALPRARVIVVRRDPRDNLLSIYKNKFAEGTHLYAYDLRDLGRYYRSFLRMVAFWRETLGDWVQEVSYDRLVANPETETRKLIAACGLAWEDGCLRFHENDRKVKTLSVYQVRQPISTASAQGWRRHEADLAELIEALGDAVPEEDHGA